MGRSLEIQSVAEGIETAEQAERMRALGCAYGQGYHFAQPIPGSDVAAGAFDALSGGAQQHEPVPAVEPATTLFRAPFGGFSRRRRQVRATTTAA
jgi:predicted signal transduction protein with EAL and GGDEF domain